MSMVMFVIVNDEGVEGDTISLPCDHLPRVDDTVEFCGETYQVAEATWRLVKDDSIGKETCGHTLVPFVYLH